MAKCKHQSTDGKRCLRPEALLPMCWVYYEYPARREQCKHFLSPWDEIRRLVVENRKEE